MAKSRKGRDLKVPENWGPSRTLYNLKENLLEADTITEAGRLLAVDEDESTLALTEALQSIARRYWEQRREAERPPAQWYRTKVGRVQKQAKLFLELLRDSGGAALAQLKWRTERQMGIPLLGRMGQEPRSIERLLDDFLSVCQACRYIASRGAPEKVCIKNAVASLRGVWIKFSGKKFPINLASADNRKDRSGRPASEQAADEIFTSPAPRFVQLMMRKIDPSVSIGAIKTALREASVKDHVV
jgi:hypothetical protein